MKLGEIIKQYRTEHGLSMDEFGALANRSKGYISMLESGKNPNTGNPIVPSIDTMDLLAKAMNMELDELLCKLGSPQEINLDSKKEKEDVTRDDAKVMTLAAHLVGHEGDLTEEEIENIKLAISIALKMKGNP